MGRNPQDRRSDQDQGENRRAPASVEGVQGRRTEVEPVLQSFWASGGLSNQVFGGFLLWNGSRANFMPA